jgi:mannose-6-phosphate isomerase-like protein (cupin superfamily)
VCDGFFGPVPLFTAAQCELIINHFRSGNLPSPVGWNKGAAASDPLLYNFATTPVLVSYLRTLLGDNILLWGASLVVREPGHVHPWHCDIESSDPAGGFVSVWIGIENTSRESALQLIAGSHRIGKTIQQVAHERGLRRGKPSAGGVLYWAREIQPDARFIQPAMDDGDALFFDGRVWHGSDNSRAQGARKALLFQYAAAGTPVKMVDLAHVEWPFQFKRTRVPVLLVTGSDESGANKIVPRPTPDEEPRLASEVHPLSPSLDEDPVAPWRPHYLFDGSTPNLSHMAAHVSVLNSNHSPHKPHAHVDEELMIVLDGEAELVIQATADSATPRLERLRRGSFVYYSAFQFHTIRNPTSAPIRYLMFKWIGSPVATGNRLQTTVTNLEGLRPICGGEFATHLLFEGPTQYLTKVHAHLTELQPPAGYAAHTDQHDVAIVMLSGSVKTMGRLVDAPGVIYYPTGALHDMQNSGPTTARYLVFEFHGGTNRMFKSGWRGIRRTLAWAFARRCWRALPKRLRRTIKLLATGVRT